MGEGKISSILRWRTLVLVTPRARGHALSFPMSVSVHLLKQELLREGLYLISENQAEAWWRRHVPA